MLAGYTTPERSTWFESMRSVRALSEHAFVPRRIRFTEAQLREAIAASRSWAEALRRLGYRTAGGNWKTLKKYAARWEISTAHFDPDAARRDAWRRAPRGRALEDVMTENSSYPRDKLKQRLFAAGLKDRRCEACGQDEIWRGRRMALILDHVNGVPNDHRFENLRVLCPNCAATLDTHCGRKNRLVAPRPCARCGEVFFPNRPEQRHCSRRCGTRWDRSAGLRGASTPRTRKLDRRDQSPDSDQSVVG